MSTAMIHMFTMTTADCEARAAVRYEDGSYACPFCSGAVLSPEGWESMQEGNARIYARTGEVYEVQPYPVSMAATYEAYECGNPACVVNMSADVLGATRARIAERAAEEARRRRMHESAMERIRETREAESALWAGISARAREAGQCIPCLRASYWQSRPKLVRHRGKSNCPQDRKYQS